MHELKRSLPPGLRPGRLRALLPVLLVAVAGCAGLRQAGSAALSLRHLEFKLDGVHPGTLAGVDLAKVTDPGSLGPLDGVRLLDALARESWPLTFTVDVAVRNPNEASAGGGLGVLQNLAWTLELDGKETISGDIPEPLEIPAGGEVRILPLNMSLDLYRYFGDRGYDQLLNLALAVAGAEGSTSRMVLTAVPTVSVGGLPIKYPGRIRIVDTQFGGS